MRFFFLFLDKYCHFFHHQFTGFPEPHIFFYLLFMCVFFSTVQHGDSVTLIEPHIFYLASSVHTHVGQSPFKNIDPRKYSKRISVMQSVMGFKLKDSH